MSRGQKQYNSRGSFRHWNPKIEKEQADCRRLCCLEPRPLSEARPRVSLGGPKAGRTLARSSLAPSFPWL